MDAWPTTLPQYVLEAGYQESIEDQTTETPMESGPAKVRRRFTVAFRRFTVTVQMDPTQAAVFEAFFLVTLAAGSLPFTWVHPRTRVAKTFRFRKPAPSISVGGSGQIIRYTMTLEAMP